MTAVRERLEALISSVLATLETASYTYTTLDVFGSEERRLILLKEKTFRMSNCWVVVLDPDLTAAFSLLRTRPFILLRLPLVDNP